MRRLQEVLGRVRKSRLDLYVRGRIAAQHVDLLPSAIPSRIAYVVPLVMRRHPSRWDLQGMVGLLRRLSPQSFQLVWRRKKPQSPV